jgi:hypothetical protein
MNDTYDSLMCVDHIIQAVLDRGTRTLYNTYLNNKIPLYTAEDIMNWNDGVM